MLLTIAISSSFAFAEDTGLRVSETEQAKREITGTVVDEVGEFVAGASIVEKGTTNGTTTGADGKFALQVSGNAVLRISYIGYVTQDIAVGSRTDIRVVLSEDVQSIDEVVVIGYGTMQRKNFTGSVSTVNVANSPIALSPRINAVDMLRGTVTGAIVSSEGDAGSNPSIEVHGQKSVNSSNTNPLMVVDGIIQGWGYIDPATIESISVLKDPTSLAIYGSQAANGVIMVTTKKGKLGKPVINMETSLTVSNKTLTPEMKHPDVFVEWQNLKHGTTDAQNWMYSRNYEKYLRGEVTDWWDFATRTGVLQNYSLSVSGATEKINYYAFLSHIDNKGIIKGDQYKRESGMLRLQNDITDWLQIGFQSEFIYHNYDGITARSSGASPYAQPYRLDGKSLEKKVNDSGYGGNNPLWDTEVGIDNYDRALTYKLKGHVLIKAPWITGLTYRMNVSYAQDIIIKDMFYHEMNLIEGNEGEERYSDEEVAKYLPRANGSSERNLNVFYVWDNILNYTNRFGKHFVDVTAVYTRDEKNYDQRVLKGSDFGDIGNTLLGADGLAFAKNQQLTIYKDRKANIGYMGRLNYNFDNRYHLTTSVRRDGSTVFGVDRKWGIFPAVGGAWTVSGEDFMENLKTVSYLKLKVSWGKNGNQTLNPYSTLSTISLGQSGSHGYVFDNNNATKWGQYVSAIGNPELGWETTTAVNVGFDVGLWDDRVHLEVDAYKSQTTEQIFSRVIPIMANGFSSTRATMGQVDNKGVEFTLNTVNIRQRDFGWTTMLNFYINRNKLVDLYGDGKDDVGSSLFIGKSLGAIYDYKLIGMVQEDDADYIAANTAVPGNPKLANTDGSEDGKITADDRTILGYKKENFRMNMSHTITYKNWELYAMLTGIFSGGGYGMAVNAEAYTNSAGLVDEREVWWTPENRSNVYPRINFTGGNFTPVMAYGYVRLQDLNLSYSFRQQKLRDIGISRLQVYVSSLNLFTFTGWVGGLPESQHKLNTTLNGVNPLKKSFSFGLNLSF
jgi:TonB-linked SusC/RagA family outer membrane protein